MSHFDAPQETMPRESRRERRRAIRAEALDNKMQQTVEVPHAKHTLAQRSDIPRGLALTCLKNSVSWRPIKKWREQLDTLSETEVHKAGTKEKHKFIADGDGGAVKSERGSELLDSVIRRDTRRYVLAAVGFSLLAANSLLAAADWGPYSNASSAAPDKSASGKPAVLKPSSPVASADSPIVSLSERVTTISLKGPGSRKAVCANLGEVGLKPGWGRDDVSGAIQSANQAAGITTPKELAANPDFATGIQTMIDAGQGPYRPGEHPLAPRDKRLFVPVNCALSPVKPSASSTTATMA